jgi:Holliday junction resolvasome RuvABC endonuclease subunit
VFAAAVSKTNPGGRKLVMALDLATTTGVAYTWYRPGTPVDLANLDVHFGQLDMSLATYESSGLRPMLLNANLNRTAPDLVGFERVRYTATAKDRSASAMFARAAGQLQLSGELMGTVTRWAEETGVPCRAYEISAIKKRATGKGNASKAEMIEACNATFGTDFDSVNYGNTGDDNIADAAWVLVMTLEELAHGFGGSAAAQGGERPRRPGEDGPGDGSPGAGA